MNTQTIWKIPQTNKKKDNQATKNHGKVEMKPFTDEESWLAKTL